MKKRNLLNQTESKTEFQTARVGGLGRNLSQLRGIGVWRGYWGLAALVIAVLLTVLAPAQAVGAQAGSAGDLIAAVNAERSANGLAAYSVDSSLMSLAQAQSNYQASIGACTHLRADGSGPGDHGISAENVACGAGLSVEDAIQGEWTDSVHTATLLGPNTGKVGAGETVKNGSVYYTLDVVRLTGGFYSRQAQQAGTPGTPDQQSATATPILTSTPNADGSVAYVIQYGETLIEIANAYGITLAELYANNPSLDPKNPQYRAGQVLIIRPAFTATPKLSPTLTPRPPTRTVRPSRTATQVLSAIATRSVTLTPVVLTPTPETKPLALDDRTIGFGFILVSVAGLVIVVIKGFIKAKPDA
jgi:LysM repeat protein